MKIERRFSDRDLHRWEKMRDAVAGEEAIKARDYARANSRTSRSQDGRPMAAQRYLPRPNALDITPEGDARYIAYLQRAHYFGVTGRTVAGLTGMATKNPPTVTLPERLEPMRRDCNGAGLSLEGFSSKAVRECLITGRGGIFTDFVETPSRESVPTLTFFPAESIRTWHSTWQNGEERLEFVVLEERVPTVDGYSIENEERLLVLSLDDSGLYRQERFAQSEGGDWQAIPETLFEPRDQTGARMETIPFSFIGSVSNDPALDPVPIQDLADTNLAHYRNSADFEESVFLLGQPWPIFYNLSSATIKRFEDHGIVFGSRAPAMLGQGERAEILQAEPNTLAQDAMKQKEGQMIKLGAQLLEPSVVMTAEQSRTETNATYSVLSSVVRNVSQAITRSLEFAALFVRPNAEVLFEIDADFTGLSLDANALREIVAGWQAGAYPTAVKNDMLRKIGATRLSDEALDDLSGREIL